MPRRARPCRVVPGAVGRRHLLLSYSTCIYMAKVVRGTDGPALCTERKAQVPRERGVGLATGRGPRGSSASRRLAGSAERRSSERGHVFGKGFAVVRLTIRRQARRVGVHGLLGVRASLCPEAVRGETRGRMGRCGSIVAGLDVGTSPSRAPAAPTGACLAGVSMRVLACPDEIRLCQ